VITIRLTGWDLLIIFVLWAVVAPFVDGFARTFVKDWMEEHARRKDQRRSFP